MTDIITMLHGSGGSATDELIKNIFADSFKSRAIDEMEDAAVVSGSGRIAVTTDSFVVEPLFYPGGNIGRLCVCGTVNDLLMRGAIPKYLTCGFILEEGLEIAVLKKIVSSLADAAKKANVQIIAGDTKVIPGNGGMYINTTGVGFVEDGIDISASNAACGDAVIVSGSIGDHHAAILAARLDIETAIKSDNATLCDPIGRILPFGVHVLRDITRGGLATVLCELAYASRKVIAIEENAIPVSDAVKDFCGIMGLDPLYMGNEGRFVCIAPTALAEDITAAMRSAKEARDAVIIGHVCDRSKPFSHDELFDLIDERDNGGALYLRTSIGSYRHLMPLADEGLPRIC